MKLESILLSEISQTQKDKYCIFLSYVESRLKKYICESKGKRIYLGRGRGPGEAVKGQERVIEVCECNQSMFYTCMKMSQ
jgi:hypothetical protein